jgi:hypothetical protein
MNQQWVMWIFIVVIALILFFFGSGAIFNIMKVIWCCAMIFAAIGWIGKQYYKFTHPATPVDPLVHFHTILPFSSTHSPTPPYAAVTPEDAGGASKLFISPTPVPDKTVTIGGR